MRSFIFGIGLFFVCLSLWAATSDGAPSMTTDIGSRAAPLTLEKMDIVATVSGPLTRTRTTMVFRNPFERQIEGELVFPLPEGARVSGYALDIHGVMVDAVPVTREKARVAFEKEVRRRVDPGIVEWTKGNHFKTRIFPIPAKGTRTIMVEVTGQVTHVAGKEQFRLPLKTPGEVGSLTIRLEVDAGSAAPVIASGAPTGLTFQPWQSLFRAEAKYEKQAFDQEMMIEIPQQKGTPVRVETVGDDTVFLIADQPVIPDIKPSAASITSLCIVWDASASRAGSHEKELDLLATYMKSQPALKTVRLFVLRNILEELVVPDQAAFIKGDLAPLKEIAYDGGTSIGEIKLTKEYGQTALLFTDGITNWGESTPTSAIPVYAFSSSAGTEYDALQAFALESGGFFCRLYPDSENEKIIARIGQTDFRFLRAEYDSAEIYSVYPRVPTNVAGTFLCSGKLLSDTANITLIYGVGSKETVRTTVKVEKKQARGDGLIARFWATQKLTHLLSNRRANEKDITALGIEYGLVTPGTSLIVLERLDQYLEHEIRPPASLADMRKQYDAQIASRMEGKNRNEHNKLEQLVAMWTGRIHWWEKTYSRKPVVKEKDKKANVVPDMRVYDDDAEAHGMTDMPVPARAMDMGSGGSDADRNDEPDEVADDRSPPPPSTAPEEALMEVQNVGTRPKTAGGTAFRGLLSNRMEEASSLDNTIQTEVSEARVAATMTSEPEKPADTSRDGGAGASIQIQAWDPKTPYLEALREADAKSYTSVYLSFRKRYATSPAFYLDVAEFFMKKGEEKLGIRVLSNIAELKLENAALLRIAAYKLMDAKQYDLAIALLAEVKTMRPEEPQSHRDLAKAYGERAKATGAQADYLQAAQLFREVLFGRWDRFDQIELIALTELNNLLHHAKRADVSMAAFNLDPRLIRNLDMDLRIVMSWDADNTDIDLHVIEPSGEEAYYGHADTQTGGHVSRDFTQGYGPESYCLRRSTGGSYKVRAKYYGSSQARLAGEVVLRLELITNFGRPNETRQSVTRRLDKPNSMIDIGTFEIPSNEMLLKKEVSPEKAEK